MWTVLFWIFVPILFWLFCGALSYPMTYRRRVEEFIWETGYGQRERYKSYKRTPQQAQTQAVADAMLSGPFGLIFQAVMHFMTPETDRTRKIAEDEHKARVATLEKEIAELEKQQAKKVVSAEIIEKVRELEETDKYKTFRSSYDVLIEDAMWSLRGEKRRLR